MKAIAGIVGPKDSVDLICEILDEYTDKVHALPFLYRNADESIEVVRSNLDVVDIWIFSGLNPYTLVKQHFPNLLLFYPELNGSSLMKVMVQAKHRDGKQVERISVDLLTERDVYETFDDLGLQFDRVYVNEYQGYAQAEDYVSFHRDLFRAGKVDISITCLRSVYEALLALDIPAYRIQPTKTEIRKTIRLALQEWETQHYRQSQIAAILVKTGDLENINDQHKLPYDIHRMNSALQSAIVDYAETILGSFVPLGPGEFMIFSTRGAIAQDESRGGVLLEKLMFVTNLISNIGIGYGETALAAEANARLALNRAQNYHEFCTFLVDSNGVIEGPLQDAQSISFGFRTENRDIHQKLNQAGVSIATFNKMLSVQRNAANHSMSAADVAGWLKMTERNARRVLNSLVDRGLAQIVGEEAPSSRGRPRKIYRLLAGS